MWYELTRGLAYLSIRHPSIGWYRFKLPAILTIFLCVIYVALPVKPKLLGDGALFENMLGVIATLPGFYFAALAAIATFNRPGMDGEIPPPAPTIDVVVQGEAEPVALTRRMFLSYMFSYLTVTSLTLCMIIVALNALLPSIEYFQYKMIDWKYLCEIRLLGELAIMVVVILPMSALAFTTLHGLFFLTERIHQPY